MSGYKCKCIYVCTLHRLIYCIYRCIYIFNETYHVVGHFYLEPITETNIVAWAREAKIQLSNESCKLCMLTYRYCNIIAELCMHM